MSKEEVQPEDDSNCSSTSSSRSPSTLRLFFVTMCFSGLQFVWALQIALLTPFMLELGLQRTYVTLVWLCGPITGLFVQPFVGLISDRLVWRWGRRRLFIIVGAILITISLLLIPNSLDLGFYVFRTDSAMHKPVAIVLTIVGFWILDISNNIFQGPCRAMLADFTICDPWKSQMGNAFFSLWIGLGNIFGYLAAFVPWHSIFRFMETESCKAACNNLRVSFAICIVFLLLTTLCSLIAADEKRFSYQYLTNGSNNMQSAAADLKSRTEACFYLCKSIFKMHPTMLRICIVHFFSWFAWFTFIIYITNWMAEYIFDGTPIDIGDDDPTKHQQFIRGLQWGCLGLAGYSFFTLITSPIIPKLLQVFGCKAIWFIGELMLVVCLGLTFIKNQYFAVVLISLFGVPYAITMTVPYHLVSYVAPAKDKGVYLGILNIFVVVPQLLMGAVGPGFIVLGQHFKASGIVLTLLCGSASAFVSCFFIFMVREKPIKEKLQAPSEEKHLLGGERASPVFYHEETKKPKKHKSKLKV